MKLNVPFVKNQKKWKGSGFCGPIALASIFKYYNIKISVEQIAKTAGSVKGGGTSPRGLAFSCLLNGLNVDYLNKYAEVKLNRKEYSNRYNLFLKKIKEPKSDLKFKKKCQKYLNYKVIKIEPTIRRIEYYLFEGKPVILFFNLGVVCGNDNLWSHYIVAVGFDKNNLYVHNIFPSNQAYQKIPKKIFENAWNSDGMDKTLIIPYHN